MKSRSYTVLAIAAVAAAALLMANSRAQTGSQSHKLEGVWTASMPGTPFHWTYVLTPADPSGQKALLKGEFVVPIPPGLVSPDLGDQEYLTDFFGEAVMAGPDTARATILWYGMKSGLPVPQIVNIGVSVSEIKFVGAGKTETTHHMKFYRPNATGIVTDADSPFVIAPVFTSSDQRQPMLPVGAAGK